MRARAERLFGFFYRIEVFVPEAKRRYGYYVFPVLEGARLIGRIDVKADREADRLAVRGFWPEAGMTLTAPRQARLMAELPELHAALILQKERHPFYQDFARGFGS